MYKRERDTTKFSDLGVHEYEEFEEFLGAPILEGLNTVHFGGRLFDFFYEDRGAPVTFITFTAAISPSFVKYPIFSSRPVAERLNMNFLSFADPASGGDEALTTFWHLGTAEIPSHEVLPKIISKAMSEGSGEHLLFFGSSAGGFAALNYSAQFSGSAVMVMNPRVSLLNEPKHTGRYVPVAFPGRNVTEKIRELPYDMSKVYATPQGNRVFYLQNLKDPIYKRHHYAHFQKSARGRDDVTFITGDWGEGHVVPPRDLFEGVLAELVGSAPRWDAHPE
ncbi:hypothetical protein [Glutamicibacter sp. AOP3-A1-12]|uniref:hypothetical protein n=1 Tax=Glutamicibacter sp. AOP3-A1-12 TaxID=3457701 RepID=UPI004033F7EE